ncbi:MAG: hypothetical protein PHQ19_06895 [Candidatus Krumholzibacteria bacterium]|nr:hypothetical protein [Candidatus Krumholzibacteria bacterium]
MADDLNLTLDRKEPRRPDRTGLVIFLLVLAAAAGAAGIILQLRGAGEDPAGLPAGEMEILALKLERQGLHHAAADAWIEYLEAARPGREEAARIWYRIGTIRQAGGDCEGALAAFYRSEASARIEEIAREIALAVEECLGRLGRFAAQRDEIESRTAAAGSGEQKREQVLAEIGAWKITRSVLTAMIEADIDAQLRQAAGDLPADQMRLRKEELLGEVLKSGGIGEYLERFVAEELLYRHAIEQRLHEDPGVAAMTRRVERSLLAGAVLDRTYAGEVSVTEDEMRAWYDANRDRISQGGDPKPYDEVRGQVAAAVRMEKQAAVQARLLGELREKYDVVIRRPAAGADEETPE